MTETPTEGQTGNVISDNPGFQPTSQQGTQTNAGTDTTPAPAEPAPTVTQVTEPVGPSQQDTTSSDPEPVELPDGRVLSHTDGAYRVESPNGSVAEVESSDASLVDQVRTLVALGLL